MPLYSREAASFQSFLPPLLSYQIPNVAFEDCISDATLNTLSPLLTREEGGKTGGLCLGFSQIPTPLPGFMLLKWFLRREPVLKISEPHYFPSLMETFVIQTKALHPWQHYVTLSLQSCLREASRDKTISTTVSLTSQCGRHGCKERGKKVMRFEAKSTCFFPFITAVEKSGTARCSMENSLCEPRKRFNNRETFLSTSYLQVCNSLSHYKEAQRRG